MATKAVSEELALALFIAARARERGPDLIDGLAKSRRDAAGAANADLRKLPSAERKVSMQEAFGEAYDARQRVEALLAELAPDVRARVVARLPLHLRPATDDGSADARDLSPMLERLLREAMR